MSSQDHSSNATSQAISIFPHQRQSHNHTQAASKPLPMVGVDIDMTMSMSIGMNVGMGMNIGSDIDIHMGSFGVGSIGIGGGPIDMDIMSDQQQHLMSWSPRPTNSFQNRFYPGASPGSLFNPIAMPAQNLSAPIPINSRKSNAAKSKPHKSTSDNSTTKRPRPVRRDTLLATRDSQREHEGGELEGEGLEVEGRGARQTRNAGAEADEEEDADGSADDDDDGNENDIDRDSDAPNSLTFQSAQAGNYTCCGVTLPDLHALVDHFENAHVQVFASPSFEALSVIGGVPNNGGPDPAHPNSVNSSRGARAVSTPAAITSSTTTTTTTATTAPTTTTSSSTSSPAAAYEFPAPPFDTDDMDISLSDDGGPSPSPPRTPGTTPSPTTSAFDPIRVVYHPTGVVSGVAGFGSAGSVSNAASAGLGYGVSTMSTIGNAFSMGGVGTQYLSPTTVSISSSSSSSASSGVTHPTYFRPSTYSSLAGGNGPAVHHSHSGQHPSHHASHNHLTTAGAFNRYAGYAEYSSNLPGTDPSPTYHHHPFLPNNPPQGVRNGGGSGAGAYPYGITGAATTTAMTGSGFNSASSSSSCLPPALLFSSSAEPSPLNTPSSSRTGSPVQPSQSQQSHSHGHSVLPNGTLPLHPSSSSSVAPSRRTPPPSALPSTASAASHHHAAASSSSSNSSKPFKCPKPGCNKSYKQQNGLKYHLSHGQCNFAPRDPEVEKLSEMEREKRIRPFVCKVPVAVPTSNASVQGAGGEKGGGVFVECGRRYKNMNGLRYHYQHTGEHGAIGLEMLAQGRHPLPDLPASHPNITPTSTPSAQTQTPTPVTSPSSPNTPATKTTTPASLPNLNTTLLPTVSSSTPLSPGSSPSPILSVPPTPLTPLSPHPLRITTSSNSMSGLPSSSSSTGVSSVSMPPSPSRYAAFGGGVVGAGRASPLGAGAGSAVGAGGFLNNNDYPALTAGKSISYPSSPVSSQNHTHRLLHHAQSESPLLASSSSPPSSQSPHSSQQQQFSAFGFGQQGQGQMGYGRG